jgi:threonine dehydratase
MTTSVTDALAIQFEDVRAAQARLTGVIHQTPVVTSRTLDESTGARLYLKAESFQRTGAFKFRGAYNAVSQLPPDARDSGVVAFSSGNHAQAVAFAAQLVGVPAAIVMPEDAPPTKIAATRGYGADVIIYDRYTANRAEIAAAVATERGATLIPPYDHPHVMAGNGTVVLELLEEIGELDLLVVCLGGGGLLAGSATAARGLYPDIEIAGVEPAAGDDWARSYAAGERVALADVPITIADGQQTQAPGVLTWPIVRRYVGQIATVTDDEIRAAMGVLFERLKLVVEPSGATALAAVLSGKFDVAGRRVGITISGGNIGRDRFLQVMSGGQ